MYFVQIDTLCQLRYVEEGNFCRVGNLFLMKLLQKKLISAMSLTSISLEITITLKNGDNRYVEIRWVVKGELVGNVFSLSLKRTSQKYYIICFDIRCFIVYKGHNYLIDLE